MAQFLLISAMTKRAENEVGDVVGIFLDSHKFSPSEKTGFTIKKLTGITVEKANEDFEAKRPDFGVMTEEQKRAYSSEFKYRYQLSDNTKTNVADSFIHKNTI